MNQFQSLEFVWWWTLNPIILGIVNGAGIVETNIGKMKNFKKKKEMTRIAFKTYEKVLVELRSALRGDEFNKNESVKGLNPGVISKVGWVWSPGWMSPE